MNTKELIEALGQLKVQTGSLACLGCGHDHNCGLHGCALIREAVTQLIEQNGWINPKERLPERGVPVLTYNKWGRARVETLRTWDEQPYFVGGLKAGTDVLFWRPLPQLPEVQELQSLICWSIWTVSCGWCCSSLCCIGSTSGTGNSASYMRNC